MAHRSEKIQFQNTQGIMLAGRLERPDGPIEGLAIFAHCFTCSKNASAATAISRALATDGIAVLRFDFTGLGNSEGDFANTNFSSNVEDLAAAANHLKERFRTPDILIGHSLGGAAVLAAAQQLPDIRAVVTIGAPFGPSYTLRHLQGKQDLIREKGQAEVELGGRTFTIRKQFIEDLEAQKTAARISGLNRPLLIFHAPNDEVVGIEEATKIYRHAKHPKSFVALDGADHLLSDKRDGQFTARMIAAWVSRYITKGERASRPVPEHSVRVLSRPAPFTTDIHTHTHHFTADEPIDLGGDDLGPSPYELLLASLGTCTSMTLGMYARRKGLGLKQVQVDLKQERIHAKDCQDCQSTDGYVTLIERTIHLTGDLTPQQRERMLEIADRCPVHRSLSNEIKIRSQLDNTTET